MVKIFKRYNFNYLILSGAIIFCCTMLIYIIITKFYINEINSLSRFDSINNYYLLIFSALVIAPIFEELFFRGYFTNNSFLKFFSLIGCSVYIYITGNSYLFIFVFILVILHFLKKIDRVYFYIINSILFSLVHYKLYDFKSLITIIPMFSQFSFGLILIWVVLNFNLFKSIVTHFLFNLFFVIILTLPLQFPQIESKNFNYLGYNFNYSKTPFFNNKNTIILIPNDYSISAENVDINKFYNSFDSNSKKIKINVDNKFYKFNIYIKKIDSKAKKLDTKTIELLLKKAKLIENR
jgi:membrane protease YdiL (CAAX protease family)